MPDEDAMDSDDYDEMEMDCDEAIRSYHELEW
jgi:hypothetical protein